MGCGRRGWQLQSPPAGPLSLDGNPPGVSVFSALFLLVSGPRERLWCGLEGSSLASLLLHTSLLPKKQGLLLPYCPTQGWFKALIPSMHSCSGSVTYTAGTAA